MINSGQITDPALIAELRANMEKLSNIETDKYYNETDNMMSELNNRNLKIGKSKYNYPTPARKDIGISKYNTLKAKFEQQLNLFDEQTKQNLATLNAISNSFNKVKI